MKKINLVLTFIAVTFFLINGHSQIKVNSSGKVGINNSSPSYHLDVNGNFNFVQNNTSRIVTQNGKRIIFSGDYLYTDNDANLGKSDARWYLLYAWQPCFTLNPTVDSDRKLKKDIENLDNTLDKLIKLRPVKYKLISKREYSKLMGNDSINNFSTDENTPQIGLIAQEVQEIFPEVVANVDSNHLGIRYADFIPILIKGLQEQQLEIRSLSMTIENLENDCCSPNDLKSGNIGNFDENIEIKTTKLYQNSPNPFNVQSTIRFEIQESMQYVQIHIRDMTGKLLKTININQRGEGSILINANEFAPGMYLYNLVCSGNVVDTKQMLLTK